MPKAAARFRISIKDNSTRQGIKVELIEAKGLWGESRWRVRQNGRKPATLPEATLTEVFDRLRRWMVRRA
jgi:hypothetical protein